MQQPGRQQRHGSGQPQQKESGPTGRLRRLYSPQMKWSHGSAGMSLVLYCLSGAACAKAHALAAATLAAPSMTGRYLDALQRAVDREPAARVGGAFDARHRRQLEAREGRQEDVGVYCGAVRQLVRRGGERRLDLRAGHLGVGEDLDAGVGEDLGHARPHAHREAVVKDGLATHGKDHLCRLSLELTHSARELDSDGSAAGDEDGLGLCDCFAS
eukprot:scaffold23482_cov63-Phaeocystis_antarctica.AAC.4